MLCKSNVFNTSIRISKRYRTRNGLPTPGQKI